MTDFNTGSVHANGIEFHYLEMGDGPWPSACTDSPTTLTHSATCCPTWQRPDSALSLPSCAATRLPPRRRTGGIILR